MAITVKHSKVSTIPDGDDSSLIRPSDWNADHTLEGLGTIAEQNANNVAITGGSISGVTVDGYIPTSEKGVANGVATLDSSGQIPLSQIPSLGDLNYQGTWNASTNTPTLTSSTGTKGYYYVVSVAGSTNLDGITDWQVGDWAVFNGTTWEKIDNTDAVTSVNGQTGTVVLTTSDISEGTNLYYTDARARDAVSAGTGISYSNATGVITNSAPDQVVSLTGAGTTTISGTYPDFTITSNDAYTGNVVGPASATDNAIARFDTTTGKLIQNSVVTVSDTGVIAGAPSISNINFVDFDTTYATALTEGQLGWDGNNTLGLGMACGNVVQRIGEDVYIYVKASSAITKGQLTMFTGAVGASSVVTAAPSTGVTNGQYIIGLAAEDIALNGFGLIQVLGSLKGFDTSAFADGDILYYDSAVTGGLTKTYPTSGPIVTVCAVTNSGSGGSGSVQVRVSVTQRLSASTGISVSQNGTSATITNTAPDQVVSISGGGTTTVTGTYPNFTVTSNDQYVGTVTSVAASAGTGISVSGSPITTSGILTITNTAPDQTVTLTAGTGISTSGTYPDFTITNTAPDQTVAITAGTGISVTGTYPNFTVTNTEPSSGGTVTSVSGTGTVSGISLSGTVTSSGNLTLGGSLDLSSPPAIGGTAPNTVNGTVINATNGIVINNNTVSASYTIPSGSSGMSAGPMTVASGVSVTVASGSRWVVL